MSIKRQLVYLDQNSSLLLPSTYQNDITCMFESKIIGWKLYYMKGKLSHASVSK